MKARAIQDVRAAAPVGPPPRSVPAAPPIVYAGIVERDKEGRPSRIALPAPVAGRVPLYSAGDRVAEVLPDGGLVLDAGKPWSASDRKALAAMRPGTRIVATESGGRIVGLTALTPRRP